MKGPSLEVSFRCESRHFAFQGPWPSDRTSKSHIANENLHPKHLNFGQSHRDFQFQGPCVIFCPKLKASTKLPKTSAHNVAIENIFGVLLPSDCIAMVIVALLASCFVRLWCLGSADGIIMQQGSTNTDFPSAIVLANGFPVIAGATYANFPGMTLAGGNDAIVVKYNLDGTVAAMTTFATTDWDSIWASTIDDSANIYLVGHTTWDLNGTNAGAGSWTNDVFIAKVDSNLNQVWLIQTGTTTNDYGYAVALDSSGKVIVGGSSAGTWPDQTQLGDNDAFIMQYDSHGNRQWVIQFGSAGDDYVYGIAVDTVDSIDDIYATGVSAGSFEGHTSSGSNDFFLIKVRVLIKLELFLDMLLDVIKIDEILTVLTGICQPRR